MHLEDPLVGGSPWACPLFCLQENINLDELNGLEWAEASCSTVWACLCAVERIAKWLPCEMKHIITFESPHQTCAGYRMPYAYARPRSTSLTLSMYIYLQKKDYMELLFWGELRVWGGSFGLYASTVKSFLTCHGPAKGALTTSVLCKVAIKNGAARVWAGWPLDGAIQL